MDALLDFLSFKTFLSPWALLSVYYLGAVGVPLLCWWLAYRVFHHPAIRPVTPQLANLANATAKLVQQATSRAQRIKAGLTFLLLFLFMELFWRMMFEFMLAYLQMRDAMVGLATQV